jgi:hypothetical protein
MASFQTSITSQISDLRGVVSSGLKDVRQQIANLPDQKARLEQVERRLDQSDARQITMEARLGIVERAAIELRSDLNNVTRASSVRWGGRDELAAAAATRAAGGVLGADGVQRENGADRGGIAGLSGAREATSAAAAHHRAGGRLCHAAGAGPRRSAHGLNAPGCSKSVVSGQLPVVRKKGPQVKSGFLAAPALCLTTDNR